MKIRTQTLTSIVVLVVIFLVLAVSLVYTTQQVNLLSSQFGIAQDIEQGAYELSYLSNDYLLYQEERQLEQWEAKYSSFSQDLAKLDPQTPQQQVLVDNIRVNQQRMGEIFAQIVSRIESEDSTSPTTDDQEFILTSWSRMEVQNQGIIFDSSRLSNLIYKEVNDLQQNYTFLAFIMLGVLLLVILLNYLFINKKILQSIDALAEGTRIIGSGHLDFTIDERADDEIGALAGDFNRMAGNLKVVTASKQELEDEIAVRKRIEDALRSSEERFRIAAESLSDVIYEWDLADRVEWFGDIDGLLGYKAWEFPRTRSGWTQAIHPDDREVVNEAIQRQLRGEAPYHVEYRIRQQDGSYQYWIARGTAIRNGEGVPRRWIGAVADITQWKIAEQCARENLELYWALVRSSRDGILILEGDSWEIIDVNPSFISMFGYFSDYLIGRDLFELDLFRSVPDLKKVVSGLAVGEYQRYDHLRLETKGRSTIDVELVLNAYLVNRKTIIQCNVRDITDIVSHEMEKTESLHQIEQNLEQLAFLNDQIRNPLAIITMVAEDIGNERADIILGETRRINDLVTVLDRRWLESVKIREFLIKHMKYTRWDSFETSR